MNKLVKTSTEMPSILNKSTFMFTILGHKEDFQGPLLGKPDYENGTNIFHETSFNDCEEECFKSMFNTICKEQNYNGDYDSNPLVISYLL